MYRIFLIALIVISCKAPSKVKIVNNEPRIFKDLVLEYIKRDLLEKKEFIPLKDSISFKKYNSLIPFDIVSICEDLISKEYSDGFSFDKSDTNIKLKALATRVRDSLEEVNRNINSLCRINETIKEKQLTEKLKYTFVLFFSEECQDKMYVEAISSQGVVEAGNTLEFYGEAYSYLFLFNKEHQIIKVYKGTILYN